jgi:hypothetical protein
MFSRDEAGDYIAVPGFSALYPYHPAYIEEFAVRGYITVLTSRQKVLPVESYCSGLPDHKVDSFGTDFLKMEGWRRAWIESRIEPEQDVESSSDSSSGSEDAGYETWSECSTEHSENLEDDIITPWAGPVSDMDDDDIESDSDEADSSNSSEIDSLKDDSDLKKESVTSVDSDSDGSDIDTSAVVGYGRWHDDDRDAWADSDSEDNDSDSAKGRPTRDEKLPSELMASITIFDRSSNDTPMRVFHLVKPLPFPLYDSPPVIHPFKSLVVWPLSAGDVLFADFLAKTYFVRKLRPSTLHSTQRPAQYNLALILNPELARHIFMKCHFSPCGFYLHFASLEGQKKPGTSRKKKDGAERPPVKLALLVSTYRLSSRKTTRSPPSLVHRARLYLGSESTLSVSKLPYTLTWTPRHLYFTRSDSTLKVSRISLFNIEKTSASLQIEEHPVLVPRKPIFLPESAGKRQVYYFPPTGESPTSTVIVGSETSGRETQVTGVEDQVPGSGLRNRDLIVYSIKQVFGQLSPPVGCYLHQETDLGGWSKSHERSALPDDLGIGQLDRRLEKFDPDDDCDREHICFPDGSR